MSTKCKSKKPICLLKASSLCHQLFCCFKCCCPSSQRGLTQTGNGQGQTSKLEIRTLTCDKLSHCLFDFDCLDLNIYEKELYNYQEFQLDGFTSCSTSNPDETTNDSKIPIH